MGPKNVIFNPDLEVIGHRGHVSHFPENTSQGFISAVELGVNAVEMDIVVSADKKVVVSHEPYMASATMVSPQGKRIGRSQQKEYNLYQMPYDSIKQYKTGLVKNTKYRNQKKIESYKPLLEEVLQETEARRKQLDLSPVTYYLEIKSRPRDYGIYQPFPQELAQLIIKTVRELDLEESVVVKSFDTEFLKELKNQNPEVPVSLLTYRTTWEEKLQQLNFEPQIVSPYYKQLKSKEQVEELQARGFKVIPWTVNSKKKIRKMINFGVDGIISDFPERVLKVNQRD